ncbi:MAG: amidase [Gammaproteobacteria bacterium]|nr:amidase [Gammaproteobacteria bacterium]MYG68078.1 amidase [Gammaproteobacteria bacterium]
MNTQNPGIRILVDALSTGELTATALVGDRYNRAQDIEGVFVMLDDGAPEQAREVDRRRAAGQAGPLEGIPVTLKDLFNVRGQRTLAGSRVLWDSAPVESEDAAVVSHLRAAGMLFLGRANMSEFAFSGMGLNPHHPPLYSVWDRETGRLPGGSSSGSAVSVALGIVPGTLGSDTAGSCRIPAAFNGIVGVKPSFGRLSLEGVYPLSPTSDAPGPLGVDVDTCFILDHLMSGAFDGSLPTLLPLEPEPTTLTVPGGAALAGLDPEVEQAFSIAVSRLAAGGITVERQPTPVIDDSIRMFLERPVVLYEVWRDHAARLESRGDEYDPYVRKRMGGGRNVSREDQENRYREKESLVRRLDSEFKEKSMTALMYPTAVCIPPAVSETGDPDRIGDVNMRCLRNAASVNYFDGCAISLPCHRDGEAPVGLMLAMPRGHDRELFRLAALVENLLRPVRTGQYRVPQPEPARQFN